jgi:RNA polymerase sigma-70 factor (ECF subfamily)
MTLSEVGLAVTGHEERERRFRRIFEQEFNYVWTSLRRLGVHSRDLDDVAQDVFVRVYRRLDDNDASRPVRPWLFAFAFRCASDWRRQVRHRVEVALDPDTKATLEPAADATMTIAEERELVRQALQHVPFERRAVVILYEFDELPMKQIAKSLNIGVFTAYSRLRVGRKEFSDAVRRLLAARGER